MQIQKLGWGGHHWQNMIVSNDIKKNLLDILLGKTWYHSPLQILDVLHLPPPLHNKDDIK